MKCMLELFVDNMIYDMHFMLTLTYEMPTKLVRYYNKPNYIIKE